MTNDNEQAHPGPDAEPYELDPIFEAVGRVAANDAFMESMLASLYARLLESPMAEFVAHGQSFEVIAQAIRAILTKLTQHPDHDALVAALDESRRLHQLRNRVVHAVWFGVAGVPEEAESMLHKRWQAEPALARWTIEELRDLARGTEDHGWAIYDLEQRMGHGSSR
jgi:hypothetical protein